MDKERQWKKKFQDWEKSGLTRTQFCRKHQISVSTFDYWRQRIRKMDEGAADQEQGLVKLTFSTKPTEPAFYSVVFPNGLKLQVPEHYSSESLNRLVQDLQEVPK